jgi:purine-nucleoside phosphorylase
VSQVALHGSAAAARAAAALRDRFGDRESPALAIVLGSGLGGLADRLDDVASVPYAELPGFPLVTVAGHRGAVLSGRLGGRRVVALAGRLHPYEGHSSALAAFPVRVVRALGARTLFVSNAAGGIRERLAAGTLMVITDHLNLTFRNPLIGPAESEEPRFPDMSEPYDRQLIARLHACGDDIGEPLQDGVYCGLVGPSYETPAEIRMARALGADAVGMSTVSEVVVARALGMRVAGVSCITNVAAGGSSHPLSHLEVLEVAARAAARFERLVLRFVASL